MLAEATNAGENENVVDGRRQGGKNIYTCCVSRRQTIILPKLAVLCATTDVSFLILPSLACAVWLEDAKVLQAATLAYAVLAHLTDRPSDTRSLAMHELVLYYNVPFSLSRFVEEFTVTTLMRHVWVHGSNYQWMEGWALASKSLIERTAESGLGPHEFTHEANP
jgi:hypothetical protein